MEFLHQEFDLQEGDVVEVSLNSPANVMLLDTQNFSNYQQGVSYRYYGGHAEKTPVLLSAPHSGKWHVVVNLGGYAGARQSRCPSHSRTRGSIEPMTTRKNSDRTQQLSPVRVAPLGELNAYTVHEHELDIIAAGSPATLAFNFAIALISIGMAFVLTLTTTIIASDRLFYGYLIVCINCLLVGVIMFMYWLKTRSSVNITVMKIKSRLVVSPPIQEQNPSDTLSPSEAASS